MERESQPEDWKSEKGEVKSRWRKGKKKKKKKMKAGGDKERRHEMEVEKPDGKSKEKIGEHGA